MIVNDESAFSKISKIPLIDSGLVALRILLGVIFVMSGVGKMLDVSGFISAVMRYGLLPSWLVVPFSSAVPLVELALGGMLVVGRWTSISSGLLAVTLLLFTGAELYAYLNGVFVASECGCFGKLLHRPTDKLSFMENGILILGLATIGFSSRLKTVREKTKEGDLR